MTAQIGRVDLTIATNNLAQVSVSTTRKPLAIIGPAAGGAENTPTPENRKSSVIADFTRGPTVEAAAYALTYEIPKLLLVRTQTSDEVAGSYGSITVDSVDGSVTGDGTTKPDDDCEVIVEALNDFTVGTTGGLYRYSLDGGRKFSNPIALGTATSITLPYGAGKYNLTSTEDWLAGESFSLVTVAPKWSDDGLVEGIAALGSCSLPFGLIEIIGPITAQSTITAIQQAIIDLRQKVRYVRAVGHFRARNVGETLTSYAAAYETLVSGIDADCLYLTTSWYAPSVINSGALNVRPFAWAVAPRMSKLREDISPNSRVEFGSLVGSIRDSSGNVRSRAVDEFEQELFTPLRAIAPRTWPDKPDSQVYVGSGVSLAADGSDTAQSRVAQVLDLAAETAYTPLADRVGRGLLPGADGITLDPDEQKRIENQVSAILDRALVKTGKAVGARLVLDASQVVVSSNPVSLTGKVLVRIKGYADAFEVEVAVDITAANQT